MARRNGVPSGSDLNYVIITGTITSALGVVIGMAINSWWESHKAQTGGVRQSGFLPPMGSAI